MGRTWADMLQPASLDGVAFNIISVRDAGGAVVDKVGFYGGSGVEANDRARKERTFQIVAVVFGDQYPDKMEDLDRVIAAGGVKELVHPVKGTLKVVVDADEWIHDVEDAEDAAMLQLTVTEHTEHQFKADTTTLPARANAARAAAEKVTTAADSLYELLNGEPTGKDAQIAATQSAKDTAIQCIDVADTIEVSSIDLSVAEVVAQVNQVRSSVSSELAAIADYSTPEMWALGQALQNMAFALGELAATVLEARPPLIEEIIDADVPLLIWLSERGISDQLGEFMALNSIPDPLSLPKGMKVRRYAI